MPYFIIYKLKWILTVYFKAIFSRFSKKQIVLQDLFGLQKFYEFWLCLWGSFSTKIFPFMLGHFCVINLNGNNLTIISSFSLIFLTNFTSYYYHNSTIPDEIIEKRQLEKFYNYSVIFRPLSRRNGLNYLLFISGWVILFCDLGKKRHFMNTCHFN